MRLWLLQLAVVAGGAAVLTALVHASLVHASRVTLPSPYVAICAQPKEQLTAQACADITDPLPHGEGRASPPPPVTLGALPP
jgi:hypothetical protein